jgi:hypothetical protein
MPERKPKECGPVFGTCARAGLAASPRPAPMIRPRCPPDLIDSDTTDAQPFIERWRAAGGSERANYQLFIGELCALLGLSAPDPARDDPRDNAYVFERRVDFAHGDGSRSAGFIDCYRRGAFVLEAKKLKAGPATKGFDDALLRARAQAESYARALPASEGRPPFVVVVDVGHVIELYAEFTRSGATYTPFPDARSHRIALAELQQPAIRERLRTALAGPDGAGPRRAPVPRSRVRWRCIWPRWRAAWRPPATRPRRWPRS